MKLPLIGSAAAVLESLHTMAASVGVRRVLREVAVIGSIRSG